LFSGNIDWKKNTGDCDYQIIWGRWYKSAKSHRETFILPAQVERVAFSADSATIRIYINSINDSFPKTLCHHQASMPHPVPISSIPEGSLTFFFAHAHSMTLSVLTCIEERS
jgi:hypothetical protein